MSDWLPPAGTLGDRSFVRTGLWAARGNPLDDDFRRCPTALAVRARPDLRPQSGGNRTKDALQGFNLAPLMTALDLIEFDGQSPQQALAKLRSTRGTFDGLLSQPSHDGLIEWTAAALPRYLSTRQKDQNERATAGKPHSKAVRHEWVARRHLAVPDHRGATYYEQTAWGRRYCSADGSVREMWLLSEAAARVDRPPGELAAAAYTAAFGDPCANAFGRRHTPLPNLPPADYARPQRVRVVAVGCGDGNMFQLLDWDAEEAARHYATDAAPVLARTAQGTEQLPGSDCVTCKALDGCTSVHRSSGSIGAIPIRRSRRSLSATDLRTYATCPAKYHLTWQLNLRGSTRENDAVRRGRAVDAFLNERHRNRLPDGCRALSGPSDPTDWSAGGNHLVGETALIGARMLAQHVALCPLDGLPPGEVVHVQRQVATYDSDLDLVILAVPDLLYSRLGGWVWRETKTATRYLWEGRPLLRQYPQLALAVLLIACGALGGDLRRSRIELELLYPDDCALEEIDPGQDTTVVEAREVIADLVLPWNRDTTYNPTPGQHCGECEALEWCRAGQEHLGATETTDKENT